MRDRCTLVPRLVFIAINVSIEWDRGERDAIKCYRAGLHGYKRSYTVGEGTRNSLKRDRAKCSMAGFYGFKCFNIMGMGAEKILERDGIKCNRAGFYSYKRL